MCTQTLIDGGHKINPCYYQKLLQNTVFDANFLGPQPTGPTAPISMCIPDISSAISAVVNVIFAKNVNPDEESSAIGRRTDLNFEH